MIATDTLEDWLLLRRLPGIGPMAIQRIRKHFGSLSAFIDAGENRRRQSGLEPGIATALRHRETAIEGVETDLAWQAGGPDRHILTQEDPRYPAQLGQIPDPPPVLFIRGDVEALNSEQLAIVGSRHATPGGLHSAGDFAAHLAASGLAITSGLALGIDAEAHQGALAVGGTTLAVMATGPDRLYPREHRGLAGEILDGGGALVTEMPVSTPVSRGLFPRRNRLISGLSLGVLVIEAGAKSGALGTAYAAQEQGREAMALPGSIHNPVARGCHRLIRDGARLVETAEHVIQEIRNMAGPLNEYPVQTKSSRQCTRPVGTSASAESGGESLDSDYQALLNAMGYDPVSFDRLAERLGLTPDILSSMLLSLELKGLVAPCNGGRYMRTNQGNAG